MSWDSYDAYGTVPAGQPTTVRLPAGPISISFQSDDRLSRVMHGDVPTIHSEDGVEVRAEFEGNMQGPQLVKNGQPADERIRRRFATAEIPAAGDYVVRAAGCDVLLGTAGLEVFR